MTEPKRKPATSAPSASAPSASAPSASAPPDPKRARRSAMLAILLHHALTVALLCAVLAVGVYGYLTYKKRGFFYQGAQDTSSADALFITHQRARLRLATQAQQALTDAPPLQLDELREARLIGPSDLSYPSPRVRYTLERRGDSPYIEAALTPQPAPLLDPSEPNPREE